MPLYRDGTCSQIDWTLDRRIIITMDTIISLKKINKYFNGLHALQDITFDVENREFVSVIGPSGCGKTTLLKIIGGLTDFSKGTLTVKNGLAEIARQKREVGFVFQKPVLLPWRNVLENIQLPLEISGGQNNPNISDDLLKLVDLERFKNFYPNELSGGMQQRVAIARALSFEPSILLMDEPFGSLDEITRDRLNLELLRIWQNKDSAISSIIFVTHSVPESVFMSDKVIVLSARPGNVQQVININLPRPRTVEMKYTTKYLELVQCIRKILK